MHKFNSLKLVIKFALIILSAALLIALTVILQTVDPAQRPPEFEPYVFADTLANRDYDLDSLIAILGEAKGLPKGFEIAAAIAYSAYPQLKDARIDMILTDYGPPMMADIDIWSLFGTRKNRLYQIKLNDAGSTFFDPILLRSLPFDAQVGILAHELGHVAYYHQLNLFQIGKWGFNYLQSDEFHATHERTTDLMPVYHGLASQIYQYAYFVRNDPSCQDFYKKGKEFMDKFYMTDKELLEVISRYEKIN